jgi:regulatory protein
MPNNQKDLLQEAKVKMARFCSYRERAPEEVRQKLAQYNLSDQKIEQVMNVLMEHDFVNERRFAGAYANGKLNINKWGKLKIRQGLEHYKLDPDHIDEALGKLPDDQYQATMIKHIEKKQRSLKHKDPFVRNHKVAQFVISKGFEPDLVWKILKLRSKT